MLKSTLIFALLGLAAASYTHHDTWKKFTKFEKDFNKNYSSHAERMDRFKVFEKNVEEVEAHNNRLDVSWKKGINQFADMTEQEFKAYARGYVNVMKREGASNVRSNRVNKPIRDLPKSVDWRDQGVISPVKDQGSCGSCWAFTTVETLESYLKLSDPSKDLEILSAQQITSCTPNPMHCGGTGGCFGSIPQLGYVYTQMFGVVRESDYPYTSGSLGITGECNFDAESLESAVYVRGYETLPHNDLESVMNHLAEVGPLAMSADASHWSLYRGGVFDGCSYDKNIEINHAIQLVGYGTDDVEGDYWIVRNSWGESWGENGYIRLKRESTEVCGLDSTPAMGTACDGDGNVVQKVCGMCGVLFDTSYPIGADTVSGIRP